MSWFSPENARNVRLVLNILLCCSILMMEGGFIAWLATGEPDDGNSGSILERALNRSRTRMSAYTHILVWSGLIFFLLLASVSLWLYVGENRLAWAVAALGMLIRSGARVIWRFTLRSGSSSEVTTAVVMTGIMAISTLCFFYWIFSPREFIPRAHRIALAVGILLLCPGLSFAFFLDHTAISPIVVEVLGLTLCFASLGWGLYVQSKEEARMLEFDDDEKSPLHSF